MTPLGLRQQAGGGVAPGSGCQFGSRQPATTTGSTGSASAAPWDAGSYSKVMSELAVIQAMSSSTWR